MSLEDVELARKYVETFDAGGIEATAPLRRPDCELHDPPEFPDADSYRGEAAGAARVESLLAMGWDGKCNVQEYIDTGDEVMLVCALQGHVALGDAPFELTLVQVLLLRGRAR